MFLFFFFGFHFTNHGLLILSLLPQSENAAIVTRAHQAHSLWPTTASGSRILLLSAPLGPRTNVHAHRTRAAPCDAVVFWPWAWPAAAAPLGRRGIAKWDRGDDGDDGDVSVVSVSVSFVS